MVVFASNNNCECPPGFSGANCETPDVVDPCAGVVCINDGSCVNGVCDCPDGFGGPDCGEMLNPLSMTTTSIQIVEFPILNPNNNTWDGSLCNGPEPDLYFTIVKDGVELFRSTTFWETLDSEIWTTNFTFEDPTETYSISLYDDGANGLCAAGFMGGINFTPYSGAISSIRDIQCDVCTTKWRLSNLTFEW